MKPHIERLKKNAPELYELLERNGKEARDRKIAAQGAGPSKTLEQVFPETAKLMRNEAKAKARQDGNID